MFEYGRSIKPATILLRGSFEHTPKRKPHLPCLLKRQLPLTSACTSVSHFILLTAWPASAFYLFLQLHWALSSTAILPALQPDLLSEPNSRWAHRNNCTLHKPPARVGKERKTNLASTAVVCDQASLTTTVWTVRGQSSRFFVATVTA